MSDKLDIYFSKVFCRMRHKTQLYNGNADDHYHTRLQHTLEVEEIAIRMAQTISATMNNVSFDLSKISTMALLHDIGHTPFGHAGERALYEIVSGKCSKEYDLPDFKKKKLAIGFKHNLNSGLLYIESIKFDEIDYDVLDGIVKHTSLSQNKKERLDYGFEFIFANRKADYGDNNPCTLEGLIVAYADEIAQVCSDYLDICLDVESRGKRVSFECPPYNKLGTISSENRVTAKMACDYLINLFVTCFKRCKTIGVFRKNAFTKEIKEFNKARKQYIKENKTISKYDSNKKNVIKSLYSFFYHYPEEMNNDFFDDFSYRAKKIEYKTNFVYDTVKYDLKTKKEIIEFIKKIQSLIFENYQSIFSNRVFKDYRTILKLYNRSIAIYISKMTDNYADHKYKKYKRKYKKYLTFLNV